ncbi:MAG: ribosome-associated translation inhibitor RaiA [Rhodospirillales bacterium]|nr:ribosome-associated translation inhibitor RaiA [Rhodospirillales bacterium]
MELLVKGKSLDVGEALRGYVEEHMGAAVSKYFAKAHDALVTISREKHLFHVDISVHPMRGLLVQGHCAAEDVYAAFDAALERIAKQLRRYKRRLNDHHKRRSADDAEILPAQQYIIAAETVDDELPVDGQPAIIAELPTEIATLSVGEAVMRMDLGDLPALMFRNTASGTLNVVYRRSDGNIGWIDPANTRPV